MNTLIIPAYFISAWMMVIVLAQRPGQQDYTIKMVGCDGKESVYAGKLEMLYLSYWGSICGDTFDNKAASVACHSLGYQRGRAIFVHNEYGGRLDRPIILRGVKCFGNETALDGCDHPPFEEVGGCTHAQDAYVACEAYKYNDTRDILGYQIKLCNSTFDCTSENEMTGLLQIKYNGVWGTVCGSVNNFYEDERKVACRGVIRHLDESVYEIYGTYMNYTNAEKPYEADATVPIWLGGVDCDGDERNLGSCKHPAWGVDTCHHYNDVWITCNARLRPNGRVLSHDEIRALMEQNTEKKIKKRWRQ